MFILGILLAGVLAAASSSAAQPVAPSTAAADIAAAKAEADALIAAADGAPFFANVTDSGVPEVRHKESGLVCGFEPGEPVNRIILFDTVDDRVRRGDDVGCITRVAGATQTLYATRYPTQADRDAAFEDAIDAIGLQFREIRPYEGMAATIDVKPAPLYRSVGRSAAFRATLDGREMYTAVTTFDHGEWSFKARTSSLIENALAASLYEQMVLNALSDALVGRPPD